MNELKPAAVPDTFRITDVNMCSPVGFLMLVRNGRDVAVVRFDEPRQGSEEGTGVSRYTAYLLRPGSERKEGVVSVEGWSGFHPFVFQKGDYRIRIGPFRLTYDFPTCLWFQDTPYEYAPTPWRTIEEVDLTANLRWFRYDAKGETSLEIAPGDVLAK